MDPSLFHHKPKPLPPPPTGLAAEGSNGKHLRSAQDHETDPSTLSLSPLTNEHDHDHECYDSTAFFVREGLTGDNKEMLFFGDVEPGEQRPRPRFDTLHMADLTLNTTADSISKRPLNYNVWKAAAPKIVAGKLCAVFLECSYPVRFMCR